MIAIPATAAINVFIFRILVYDSFLIASNTGPNLTRKLS
jgi:hypothetical protein